MRSSSLPITCFVAGAVAALGFFVANGCGGSKGGSGFDTGDTTGDGGGEGGAGFGGSGRNDAGIDCNVSGTVAGTAYAPNGTLPLYNVIVFAPTQALDPLTDGVSCDTCGSVSGKPAATTVSDATGHFELQGVPAGDNVPIVFQVGKWRRQVTVPHVDSGCATTTLTDPNMTRLPKNHTEGDIPHIAVTTGDCDSIACVLPKMGIDSSEFGVQSEYASKRVIMYQGDGPSTAAGITKAQNLWGVPTEISKYDVAIFSCECYEAQDSKSPGDETVVSDYLNAGGRTFGTDFMYTW
ncbi:MAG: carboxypeptidase regulatory-like domain-containing protein, partial [Polyangiaceae bacterium]